MKESPSLSTNFLDRLKEMQPTAWSRLVDSFSPIVYAWCRKSGLSGHDAADVVQEVFTSVARGISRFDKRSPNASFRAWLSTVTRTRLADHFRKNGPQAVAAGGSEALQMLAAIPDLASDPEATSEFHSTLTHRILLMIEEEFEPQTWVAFYQTAVEGRQASEVAQSLSMNVASVYQARCRVLRRLKARLAELPQ